jgi:hypothetical protein
VLKELPLYGSSRLGVYKVPAGGLETDQNKLPPLLVLAQRTNNIFHRCWHSPPSTSLGGA